MNLLKHGLWLLVVVGGAFLVSAPGPVVAQEGGSPEEKDDGPGPNVDGYGRYLEVREAKYVAAAKPGETGYIRMKFDLSTTVPKGAIVSIMLEFMGLDFEEIDYTLKTENRKGLNLAWRTKKRLATGDYFLRTRLYPKKQTPAVRRVIRGDTKSFPTKNEPWPVLYMKDEWKITVGGEAEIKAEQEAICEAYVAKMDALVENMNEFVDKMEEIKKGKDFVSGGKLDVKKLEEYVVAWRKKQGETQQSIIELQLKEPAIFMKTQTAFLYLRRLGAMVSKRAWLVQNEVTEQFREQPINPPSHQFFDRNYRYKVDLDKLQEQYGRVLDLVCPEEEEPVEEAAPPAAE